jgi:hypothetical protein
MKYVQTSLLFPLFFAFAGNAAADCLVSPPTKEIRIKNNSPETIFPVIGIPIYDKNLPPPAKSADLWMQAQCGISEKDSNTRRFTTSKVYRAYINLQGDVATTGVPPGSTVKITVPFYTRLQENITNGNLGLNNDQFIDWWNSSRIYFFYGKAALNSAILDGEPKDIDFGKNIPNQIKPTCTIDTQPATNCQIVFKTHKIEPRGNIPLQLQEYTFASAEGPPPGGSASEFKIELQWVNYNVSSLDSVYLPVAMGPILNSQNPEGPTTYLGDGATVADFNKELKKFSSNGKDDGTNLGIGWPYYIPIYFADRSKEDPKIWPPIEDKGPDGPKFPSCSFIVPFTDANPPIPPYLAPKIPGTANFLIESYRIGAYKPYLSTISPPLLSSQPRNFAEIKFWNEFKCNAEKNAPFSNPPALGTNGQAVVDLWTKCTTNQLTNETCDKIKDINKFFLDNYKQSCSDTPDLPATIFAVYGWVPIKFPLYPKAGEKQCEGPALVNTNPKPTAFNAAITKYCELQYNYLTSGLPQELVFNPYTQLIHGTLQSSAYAFSIDDAQAFRHLVAPGVIITIGGTPGLDDPIPTPLPNGIPGNPNNFKKFCRQGLP